MPSIFWSSWGSEVHFPCLMAGFTGWGLLGLGWETAFGPHGYHPESLGGLWQYFWPLVNFMGTLGRLKD